MQTKKESNGQAVTLSQINVYPVKSTAGISLSSAWVEKQGLSFDRRFLVADMNGKMITSRSHHQLVLVKSALQSNGLVLTYPKMNSLHLSFDSFEMSEVGCQVWSDQFNAYSTHQQANQWFSDILGEPVQLLYCGQDSNRMREKIQTNVSFADGYPLLVISQASLDDLNQRSPTPQIMDQFRTNLVIANTLPFAEDSWHKIKIGEVEFEVMNSCMRCVLTTVNPKDAIRNKHNEPLKTLSTYRSDENGGVYFGQNLVALNEGMIRAGDQVEIISTKTPDQFINFAELNQQLSQQSDQSNTVQQNPRQQELEDSKTVTISVNGTLFEGNTEENILDQAEKAGIALTHSCRSGFCGACMMRLESGNVEQPEMPGLFTGDIAAKKVLTCCCVPKSDVELVN